MTIINFSGLGELAKIILRRMLTLQQLINPPWRCLFYSPYNYFYSDKGFINCNATSFQQSRWSELVAWVPSLLVMVIARMIYWWHMWLRTVIHTLVSGFPPWVHRMEFLCAAKGFGRQSCCPPILHFLENFVGSSHVVVKTSSFWKQHEEFPRNPCRLD